MSQEIEQCVKCPVCHRHMVGAAPYHDGEVLDYSLYPLCNCYQEMAESDRWKWRGLIQVVLGASISSVFVDRAIANAAP
jgi:hypothetical protein